MFGALYPSKSGLINKHIVKHIAGPKNFLNHQIRNDHTVFMYNIAESLCHRVAQTCFWLSALQQRTNKLANRPNVDGTILV